MIESISSSIAHAVEHPWVFISFALAIGVWRVIKFLGFNLFDDVAGILPKYLRASQKDTRDMKNSISKSNTDLHKLFIESNANTSSIEMRLATKIDNLHDDVKLLKRD
jgi:hypothetical protein